MKKIICLVVAFICCMTVTCYAGTSFKDVKGTKYEDAVDRLVSFEIVNGFDDGTFKPNDKVTRTQLSKMLVISMGMNDQVEDAKKKYLNFSDVLSSHWGYGYIKVASDKKLVNGYAEDGTFRPDGNVTYVEATAMIVRALGYDDAVKGNGLTWPNNYMVYADEELDLFDSISDFKATNPVNRGDIAIMIWNALRTGVAEIVATTSTGGIKYGEGNPMISEYLGYTYLEDAEIVDVDFDDNYKTATVEFKVEDSKKTKSYDFPAEDVLDMFGRKVTILYDNEKEEIIDIDAVTDCRIVEAEVSRISEKKVYVVNKSTGYRLTNDTDILLYGIDNFSEAVEVILLLDETDIEYCIARGASSIKVGVVIDDDAKIDDDGYGIEVRELGQTKGGEKYYLADENNWPNNNDVIMYYINEDEYLIVIKDIKEEDAKEITEIKKDSIKLSNKKVYEFDSKDDYTIISKTNNKLKKMTLEEIDKELDMICVRDYNAHLYFFVFEDAVENNIDQDILNAIDELEIAIEEAEECDEEEYSQRTYATLMSAVEKGKLLDYSNTKEEIDSATDKIVDAIDELDEVSSRTTEGKTVKAKKALRKIADEAKEDIVSYKDDYTKDSYNDFYEVYDDVVDLLKLNNLTLAEIEELTEELNDAIDNLVDR